MSDKKKIPINRMNKWFSLYGLYCPDTNELRYIGITTGSLETRLKGHLYQPTNGKIALWFNDLKKKNKKPIIKLIRKYETYEELLLGGVNEIKKNRETNVNLLNISDGGDLNPMFGKTHTKEAREKISKARKGKKLTDKQKHDREKLLKKLWGNDEWSKKIKDKMSKNMIGNKRALGYHHTNKTKEFLSNLHKGNKYNLGFKHSDQTKLKMSENNKGENNPMFGKRLSNEILRKRSENVKKNGTFKGKNNPNFKFNIKEEDLLYLYISNNKTIKDISKIYGCSVSVINRNLKKYKINKPKSNKYSLNIKEIKTLIDNGYTQVEIGEIYGCSNKIINKYIKNHG